MAARPDEPWRRRTRYAAIVLMLLLSACAHRASSKPAEHDKPRNIDAEYREVVRGDTLYSIAWESGRDYRELAAWNDIAPPYTIKLGQKIKLRPPSTPVVKKPTGPNMHTVQKGETLYSIAARYDVTVADIAIWNTIPQPYVIKIGQTLRLSGPTDRVAARTETKRDEKSETPKTAAAPINAPATNTKPVASSVPVVSSVGAWTAPADGNILTRFGDTSRGIDIGGKPGQPIVAAAPGTVVYQGSGLRGYGQLIIVKHNTDFLSAYAHCDRIVVREGNVIKRGQKIAEMGSTGTDRVKLHFEIRYRGTPVDPLNFISKK